MANEQQRRFGRVLYETTTSANVSTSHLATITRQPSDTVVRWFEGVATPRPSEVRAIKRYLGLMGLEEQYFDQRYNAAVQEVLDEGASSIALPLKVRSLYRDWKSAVTPKPDTRTVLDAYEFPEAVSETDGPAPHREEWAAYEDAQAHEREMLVEQGTSLNVLRHGDEPPQLLADPDGNDGRPDPRAARTEEELLALLREFRAWAGGYSARELSRWSKDAFSHTTVNALLSETRTSAQRPPFKLKYLQGIVRACGGDDDEIRRWTAAWRLARSRAATQEVGRTGEVIALQARSKTG